MNLPSLAKVQNAYSLVVTGILITLLVLVGTGKLSIVGPANLQIQSVGFQGWSGGGNPAYTDTGAPAGQPGSTGGLLDQTDYIASWSPNLIGQRVTTLGSLNKPTASLCGVPDTWGYRISLGVPGSTPISGWNVVLPSGWGGTQYSDPQHLPDPNTVNGALITYPTGMSGAIGSGPFYAPATYWDMASPDGKTVIPEGSVVHVEFLGHFGVCIPGTNPGVGWRLLATDEARIHTGIGSLSWDRSPALYQISDVATCSWTIGYVSDPQKGLGWALTITSVAQGGAVVAQNPSLSTLTGSLAYTVTTADWAPNKGQLRCDLYNNLFSKDFVIASTIDNTSLAPTVTITGVSPQSPQQGASITVSWTAAVNPYTKSPLSRIQVIYGWGSPSNDISLPGNATSYTFPASQSGFLRFAIVAWDSAGRPSGAQNIQIQVNAQAANGGLSQANSGGGAGGVALIGVVLLLGIGLVLLLLGLYVFQNPVIKFPLIIIGVALSLIGVVLAGWLIATAIAGLFPKVGG